MPLHGLSLRLRVPVPNIYADLIPMMTRLHRHCIACVLPLVPLLTGCPVESQPVKFAEYDRPVMTWVPPYAVKTCQARLASFEGSAQPAHVLTHLGLQFWSPAPEGGVVRVGKTNETSDAAIAALREWGHTNGVRVLLCVFNGAREWDWDLARAAFAEHPDQFIQNLLNEVRRHGLDGVDLDLEGSGNHDADRHHFVRFVRSLSGELHGLGLHLTVDSFAYKWNAPNQGWWAEILPHTDGLTTMGYTQTGAEAEGWRGYTQQVSAAGNHAHKLMIGMPSRTNSWQGQPLLDHIRWVRDDGRAGVSIWDAQFKDEEWLQPEVWRTLQDVSARPPIP